ncbi:MAG: phytanoyl-CoA dioxygenase family protein [Chromatiales bacterium]|nr:phytanoyl-CoA dioxygenase family protein [Chromatiales bacterium]
MIELPAQFEKAGYVVLPDMVLASDVRAVELWRSETEINGAGTRTLLDAPWCVGLAARLRCEPRLHCLLPRGSLAVQCIYFEKSESSNWLVAPHRDTIFPVKERVSAAEWGGWSTKDDVVYGRPPREVLRSMVAVRVHLEASTEANGPLRVAPGSHREDGVRRELISQCVPALGALVMRPLLIHASSKLKVGLRRVLHIVYGPAELPGRALWRVVP